MLKILNHPLIKIKLTEMRNKNANHSIFRKNLNEIASLMVFEILRSYKGLEKKVKTPTGAISKGLKFGKEIVVIPILRAGLGMVQGIENLVPQVRIGHIGTYRDKKNKKVIEYFYKIPKVNKNSEIIIVDPMLATGLTAIDAIKKIQLEGFTNIKLVCLVGIKEGIKKIEQNYPNIKIFLAAVDEYINEKQYIVPGLGDAGDRIFGTK